MSGLKPTLRLDWCSHAAAKYAVEHWHYSRSLPTPPLVKIGVWEDDRYIGVVIFARGANKNIGRPYGLVVTSVAELVRVALALHHTPVSRIISIAIRMLRQRSPSLRLVVSFADPEQGHVGSVYQAGGWVYTGQSPDHAKFRDASGRTWHPRQVSAIGVKRQYGTPRRVPKISDCVRVPMQGKHRYLYPLDAAMRAQVMPLARPYPKRLCAGSIDGDAPAFHAGEGGSVPTSALYVTEDA